MNFFKKLGLSFKGFFIGFGKEIKRTRWTTIKDLKYSFIVVVLITAFLVGFFMLIDQLFISVGVAS